MMTRKIRVICEKHAYRDWRNTRHISTSGALHLHDVLIYICISFSGICFEYHANVEHGDNLIMVHVETDWTTPIDSAYDFALGHFSKFFLGYPTQIRKMLQFLQTFLQNRALLNWHVEIYIYIYIYCMGVMSASVRRLPWITQRQNYEFFAPSPVAKKVELPNGE